MSALSLFCDHCGAANASEDTTCCFCGHALRNAAPEPAVFPSEKGALPVDTLLKGRYRIVAPLGNGGMSTVYRAQDTALHKRTVVVKELRTGDLNARDVQDATEAFQREAAILAGLQHPNLPSIFEQFEQDGQHYLVMSFIQGEALDAYLARSQTGKLPVREVLQIGQQLCGVLHYLHCQHPSIIYRDLKPANIIRAPDGQIYLIDFGVARRFKAGQHKDTVPFGSPGYAPPEQFGRSQTTPRSDIYSLGVTLYQLLSGYEPDSTAAHFPPLATLELTVPAPLVQLVAQMMHKDESKRPASMLLVGQTLQEISQSAAVLQPFSSTLAPKPVSPTRRRLRLAASLVLLVAFCLGISGFTGSLVGGQIVAGTYNTYATATATTLNATATAIENAAYPDPYPPGGTLALVDPLTGPGVWQSQNYSDPDWGGSCNFQDNTLQMSQVKITRLYNCNGDDIYANFTIQVKMTILQGDCGGIILREGNDYKSFYNYLLCSDGTYYFWLYSPSASNASSNLAGNTTSPAIKTGMQTNTIAVVANRNTFDLYANGQKIESVNDTSYTSGMAGLVASASSQATTVAFQDLRIWTLP